MLQINDLHGIYHVQVKQQLQWHLVAPNQSNAQHLPWTPKNLLLETDLQNLYIPEIWVYLL